MIKRDKIMHERVAFNMLVDMVEKEGNDGIIRTYDPDSGLRIAYNKECRCISMSYMVGNRLACLLVGPDYSCYDEFSVA